jgi:hypothetical protein
MLETAGSHGNILGFMAFTYIGHKFGKKGDCLTRELRRRYPEENERIGFGINLFVGSSGQAGVRYALLSLGHIVIHNSLRINDPLKKPEEPDYLACWRMYHSDVILRCSIQNSIRRRSGIPAEVDYSVNGGIRV